MQFKHVCLRQRHMATTFSFTASVPEYDVARAERILEMALGYVGRLENELTEFRPQSPVYQWNQAEIGAEIPVSESVLELLELAETVTRRSSGGFSVFSKSRLELGESILPISYEAFAIVDRERMTLLKRRAGARLGFGAIGKGFALDKVATQLLQAGLEDFVLSAGGSSIILSGFAAPGLPWDWGWSWRKDSEGESEGLTFLHQSGRMLALGVSGLHEQGQHILDPRSGIRAAELGSALVSHRSAALADGYSTALFVLGWDVGANALYDPVFAMPMAVIDRDECPIWNGAYQAEWGPVVPLSSPTEIQPPSESGNAIRMLALFIGLFICSPLSAWAEGDAVDLSALGLSTFTPYIVERNNWWIALPVILLLVVSLHLPFPWNVRGKK